MIIDKNRINERHHALMDAFCDPVFQQDLSAVMKELKAWLGEWISEMSELDSRISNVYSIESRVKGKKTFEEKLFRKNYIHDWDISDEKNENQKLIKLALTDLIGLRVNCHFVEYEPLFFQFFQDNTEKQLEKGFEFNFKENTKQKNNNTLLKFSGTYRGEYHFEIQIKSIVHNVWGEVEHKTVYKNPTYDSFFEQKKRISGTLHDVMIASDKELYTLFNMRETEEQLFHSLFFCKTCAQVAETCNTSVLGEHYNSYFNVFQGIEPIKKYLVAVLGETEFQRNVVDVEEDEFFVNMRKALLDEFPHFFLYCLFSIDSVLNKHQSFDAFLIFFLKQIIKREPDDFSGDFNGDFNGQDEDSDEPSNEIKDYLNRIDELLGGCRIKQNNQ